MPSIMWNISLEYTSLNSCHSLQQTMPKFWCVNHTHIVFSLTIEMG